MKLNSNTILITGGASGIGFELASRLLQLGNTVIITGRDQSKLELAKKKLPAIHTFHCDVKDPQSIESLYKEVTGQFPELNFLINNAGIMHKINLHNEEIGLEEINEEIETNISGPIRMVKQFLPHLKTKKSAAIMNLSSALAFVPFPILPVYSATKAAVHSFTQSLRAQLQHTNVKVFELAPPLTETPLIDVFDPADMKGAPLLSVTAMVDTAIKGLQQDRFEIRPGQSNLIKFMSRLAPKVVFNILNKSTDRMLKS